MAKRRRVKLPNKGWKKKLSPQAIRDYVLSREGVLLGAKIAGSGFLLVVLIFLYFAKDLPSPSKINARVGAQTTKFFDRSGQTVLYEVFGDKNRSVIDFNQMPNTIKNATVAVEDRNFYKHGAFSVLGIIRAAVFDLVTRGRSQGGSTITQQYVKNTLLSSDRTFSRKIKELILSIEIEQFYKKDDIIKLYLNEIPYGSNAYGIQAAAKTYYNKDLTKNDTLTIDEAATLAAIPRAPTYYSPYGNHPDALIARRNLILDLEVQQHYISAAEADAAKKIDPIAKIKDLNPVPKAFSNIVAPHFVLWVQEQLEDKYGAKAVTEGGWKVVTTLDLDKQKAAEDAISKNINNVRSLGGSNSSLVAGDPKTGQVLAMVGSYDFNDRDFGAYNVAISNRQPGSSFKPIVYATAFAKNYGPGTTIYDVETDFGGGYKPKNYSLQNYGVQSMRSALAGSLNVPAVKTLYLAGLSDALDQAHKLGITTLNDNPGHYGLSLVLGSGEVKVVDMVNAYESFANGGVHYTPSAILKVTDSKNTTIEEWKIEKNPKRVLDQQVAYLISHVLSDNGARTFVFGNFSPLIIPGHTAAVKTGTTSDYKDAWTIGYTPSLVAGVWAGNNDNRSMTKAASAISAPIWHDFMVKALAGKPEEGFVRPAGVKEVALDANTGKLPAPGAKGPTRTDLFPSWYKPTAPTDGGKTAKIDKVSGKLATSCTPPLAIDNVVSAEIHAEISPNDPAYGRWEPPVQELAQKLGYQNGGTIPTESDNVHHCDDVKPKVDLKATPGGGGSYHLKATVTSGTFTANKLDITLDDQIISTQTISGSTVYEFDNVIETNGGHVYKATVTDSGLYQATDTVNVTVSGAGGGSFHGLSPTGTHHGALVSYSWTAYTEGSDITYQLFVDGAPVGAPITGTVESGVTTTPGAHSWFVRALSDNSPVATSPTISYTNAVP